MVLDFKAAREQVDMVEIAGMYTELVRTGKEWTGPCPKCGGTDRFHIFSDRCVAHCRRCEGRWDAAGLVAEMEGISNYQAVIRLLGDRWRTTKEKVRPAAEIPLAQPAQWRLAAFQEQAKKAVCFGRRNLTNQREGAAYLTGTRCLSASTLEAYQIGFNPNRSTFQGGPKQPAILIPWILATGDICALKYRFLGEGIRPRFNQKAGSEPILFGSHLCQARGTLIVVEGELNCASVFQVLPQDVADRRC